MYISLEEGEDDTATLAFAFNGNDNSRQWDIKITQIECNSGSRCVELFEVLRNVLTSVSVFFQAS